MLFSPTQCSNKAFSLVLCFSLCLNVLAVPTTHQPTTQAHKNAQTISGKERSTRKPWVAPHQRAQAKKQREEDRAPDEYYEDAAEMEDGMAEFFPESPYEGIDYREELIKHKIVPDFLHVAPDHPLEVYYRDAVVKYGNVLSYNETIVEPRIIKWHHEPNKHYTLIMTDPDGPYGDARSHEEEWHHWLVTNIYEHHVGIGDIYAQYIGVTQSRGKHLHRYVFLVYEQPGNETMEFDEIHLGPEPIDMLRGYFSTKEFAKKYNLTGPIACNFFLSDWSKAPRIKLTTEKPFSTILPEDWPNQDCHLGEDINEAHQHPHDNIDDDFEPDISDLHKN